MNKTISIQIAGMLFHIDEDAYARFRNYLQSIREHFASFEDSHEIVHDIESRIAERFSESLTKTKQVISADDVDALIASMGTVKDFEAFEQPAGHASSAATGDYQAHTDSFSPKASRRLYRDGNDQVLGGVAAGIAKYMGIDPVVVRLLFVLLTIAGGYGILIYIVLWIILPEAKTPAQQMEMQGKPVTLSAIEAKINETLPKAQVKPGTLRRVSARPFALLRDIFKALGKVLTLIVPGLGRLVGLLMLLVSSAALFSLTFATLLVLANRGSQYIDVPPIELLGHTAFYVLLGSGFMIAFVPLAFLFGIGLSLVRRRWTFHAPLFFSLLGMWIAALLIAGVTGITKVPEVRAKVEQLRRNGGVEITKTFDARDFDSISMGGSHTLVVRQGNTFSVTARGLRSELDRLHFIKKDSALGLDESENHMLCLLCKDKDMVINITMPTLKHVDLHGTMSATVNGFSGSNMDVYADGASSIEGKFYIQRLTVGAHGASSIIVAGSGETLHAQISGTSQLEARDYEVHNIVVKADGASNANLFAIETLTGEANGNSTISYHGNARNNVQATGISDVHHMDN
ncbi:MAG: putative stress-responsive transcriptional regulator [Candidatus Peribacteria bacterium]|nr:putative stress-responsive transcriptional regulator [Candidatus Peribacteria bacterium]